MERATRAELFTTHLVRHADSLVGVDRVHIYDPNSGRHSDLHYGLFNSLQLASGRFTSRIGWGNILPTCVALPSYVAPAHLQARDVASKTSEIRVFYHPPGLLRKQSGWSG